MNTTTTFVATIAERLNTALEIRGLRRSDLADMIGLDRSYISQYCNGKKEPKRTILHLMADALNVSPVWLMGGNVPMDNPPQVKDDISARISKLSDTQKDRLLSYLKFLEGEKQ